MKKITLVLLMSLFFVNSASAKSNRDVLFDSLQKVKSISTEHISTQSNVVAVNKKIKDGLITNFGGQYFFDFSKDLSSPKCQYADVFVVNSYYDSTQKNTTREVKRSLDGYRYDVVNDEKGVFKYWTRMPSQPDECLSKNNFVNSFSLEDKNDITVQKMKNDMVAGHPAYNYKIIIKAKAYQKFSQDYLASFKDGALG